MRSIKQLTNQGVIQFTRIIVSDESKVVYGVDSDGNMWVTPLQVNGTFSYKMRHWDQIPNKYPPRSK